MSVLFETNNFVHRAKAVVLTPADLLTERWTGTPRDRTIPPMCSLQEGSYKVPHIRRQLKRLNRSGYCTCLCVMNEDDPIFPKLVDLINEGYYGELCVRVGACKDMVHCYAEVLNANEYDRFRRVILGELKIDPSTKRIKQILDNETRYKYSANYLFYSDYFDLQRDNNGFTLNIYE